jgi:hypothetical protein
MPTSTPEVQDEEIYLPFVIKSDQSGLTGENLEVQVSTKTINQIWNWLVNQITIVVSDLLK